MDYGKHTKLSSDQMDKVARVVSSRHAWTNLLAKRKVRGPWATTNDFISAGIESPQALRIAAVTAHHLIEYRVRKAVMRCREDDAILAWLQDASISPSWIAYGPYAASVIASWPDDAIGKRNALCVAHLADFLAEVAYA